MKHIQTPFIFSVMLFIVPLSGQKMPWYKNKENIRGHIYQTLSVPTINTIQAIQSKLSSALIITTSYVDKNIFQKKITSIESEFKKIENDLRSQEQEVISAIFRKNELDEQTILFCLNIRNDLKKFGQEYMSKPQPNIHHDKTIPAELYAMIIKRLKKNNINPDSIDIIDKIEDQTLQNVVFEDAITMAPYFNWGIKENLLVIHKEHPHFYGFITLLPKIKKASIYEQKAILAHECEHIKEQHSTTCGIIKSCLYRLTNDYNEDQLLNSIEWRNLTQIHEQEAEIFPSLRDPIVASLMRKTRAAHHYTGMLYEGHYNTLSRIDEMWKQYDWLKKTNE